MDQKQIRKFLLNKDLQYRILESRNNGWDLKLLTPKGEVIVRQAKLAFVNKVYLMAQEAVKELCKDKWSNTQTAYFYTLGRVANAGVFLDKDTKGIVSESIQEAFVERFGQKVGIIRKAINWLW